MDCCVQCYSVYVPITAAVCVGLKSDHQVVASGIEHINADGCLIHDILEPRCSILKPLYSKESLNLVLLQYTKGHN